MSTTDRDHRPPPRRRVSRKITGRKRGASELQGLEQDEGNDLEDLADFIDVLEASFISHTILDGFIST